MGTLIQRPLNWLMGALQVTGPDLPKHLDSSAILAVLDALQGGVAIGTWEHEVVTVAASTAAGDVTIKTNTVNECRLFTGIRLEHGGGAADLTVRLKQFQSSSISDVIFSSNAIPLNDRATWKDVAGTIDARWYLPPGWRALASHTGTGVGETLSIVFQSLLLPAGFKPW